jgi:hypothetical protein
MSSPYYSPSFNHPNNIRWRKRAVKYTIMQFSPRDVYSPFRSKYFPRHSFLKNTQSMYLPQSDRPSFAPIQHNWQNYRSVYFILYVFWYETGRQKILDWIIASIPWI